MSIRPVARLFSLLLLITVMADVSATRRGVRVDGFGTWDEFAIPSADCQGSVANSTLLFGPGLVFSGRDNGAHDVDMYCQEPTPGTLNEASFFYPDETALAQMFGDNPGDRVTARRYSFLDRPRFDFDNPATGFQWTFYYFPQGGTIVGLYGLADTVLDSTSYITYNGIRVWDASVHGFDGQYFCFDGIVYRGTWNGELDDSSACVLFGFRVFRGSFE